MANKYQIFISSTYEDLKEERAQVIKAVLEMGHIPVGMEMFSAADEEQWKIITRQIDETDYYVLISGHRYGSMTGAISYTEKEYDYAISKGVPVYSFLIDQEIEPLAKNTELNSDRRIALDKFKAKAKQRPVSFWKSAAELHGAVSIALMKAFNTTPRVGWTRTTTVPGPEVMQELSRLSKENAELRAQIGALVGQEVVDQKLILSSHVETLKSVPRKIHLRKENASTWEIEVSTTLFEIFTVLSTEMMVEVSTTEASKYLGVMFNDDDQKLSKNAPVPLNFIREIFADLSSMDLVEPSKKKHPVSDTDDYWTLSSSGLEMLKMERVSRLERSAEESTEVVISASYEAPPDASTKNPSRKKSAPRKKR